MDGMLTLHLCNQATVEDHDDIYTQDQTFLTGLSILGLCPATATQDLQYDNVWWVATLTKKHCGKMSSVTLQRVGGAKLKDDLMHFIVVLE